MGQTQSSNGSFATLKLELEATEVVTQRKRIPLTVELLTRVSVNEYPSNDALHLLGPGTHWDIKSLTTEQRAAAELDEPHAFLLGSGQTYICATATLEAKATPTTYVLSRIWNGTDVGNRKEAGKDLERPRELLEMTEVCMVMIGQQCFRGDGEGVFLATGRILEVFRVRDDTGLLWLRDEAQNIYPMSRKMIRYFSVTHKSGRAPLEQIPPVDTTNYSTKMQKRCIVVKSFKASRNLQGRELQKKGHKVLLFQTSSDVMWLRTDADRIFCVHDDQASGWLRELPDKRAAIETARTTGVKAFTLRLDDFVAPWEPLVHFNPRVQSISMSPSEDEIRAHLPNAMHLSRTTEEMPLQPHDYVYPVFATPLPPFGQWCFAGRVDAERAAALGLWSASLVMHEAQRGHPSLDDILICWAPGMIDGTQGAFGEANAYIHLGAIDSRIAHWSGAPPVDPRQLAVHAGTDPYWWERRGSDNGVLHQLRIYGNPRRPQGLVRTEVEIEQQINDHQGFRAERVQRADPESIALRPAEKAARDLLLRACDPSTGLGLPMAVDYPIKVGRLEEDTSFHPGFVGCGYRRNLHPVN
ncbi:hypothetical protein LTR86_002667 [Recurvomyces mirabilis]|nr:hypothetical protein LTR86_002667 [Recurvomyces mirabilis]